jgi:Ni,Fe-hydrogenase maturation factor
VRGSTAAHVTNVHVLVCGHRYGADSAAPLAAVGAVVASLRRGHRLPVQVVARPVLDLQHLLEIPPGAPALIVDAADGAAVGTVVTRSLDDLIDDPGGPRPHNTRQPAGQLLGMANVLSDAPRQGLFVGIGGADFGPGTSISPPVKEQLPTYAKAICVAIAELAAAIECEGVPVAPAAPVSRPGRRGRDRLPAASASRPGSRTRPRQRARPAPPSPPGCARRDRPSG